MFCPSAWTGDFCRSPPGREARAGDLGLSNLLAVVCVAERPGQALRLPIPLPRCLCGWGVASDLHVAFRPSSRPALPLAGASLAAT